MAANEELKLRCPSCGARYKLPAAAVGRRARCTQCQAVFRVVDSKADSHRSPSPDPDAGLRRTMTPAQTPAGGSGRPAGPKGTPTEDEILRWLSEAEDDAERERRTEMSSHDTTSTVHVGTPRTVGTAAQTPRLRLHPAPTEDADQPLTMRRVV